MHRFLRCAIDYARDYGYDDSLSYHLCAIIVRGGKILSIGYNKRTSSAMQEHYRTSEFCCSVHAEVDAILKVRRKINLVGAKIYIVRRHLFDSSKAPSLGMAKPCEMCRTVLYAYGIRKVVFSIDNDSYGVLKITNPRKN